ncbi:hypothetical protein GCM10009527_034330 [Actinomadura nitritigenes]|uniref:Uncharacterized protein n=1 Tax=Actinomadura nitritigenes TaxID=134602 RepID=A0ABS3RBL6_9ACTN|nr:hypothetical protein [Actinomadura nitritigenes]MBO2443601.1 hypothetical protein [Actinomadura nitritigenes]
MFGKAAFPGDAVFAGAIFEAGVDMASATMADVTGGHTSPLGWWIEPSEGGEWHFVRDLAPASAS